MHVHVEEELAKSTNVGEGHEVEVGRLLKNRNLGSKK